MSEKKIRTAMQALELWDAGQSIPAFEVESEVNEQETLWGAAFDRLARRKTTPPPIPFTKRERAVIDSIVFVAQKLGWHEMVKRHVHERSPAITIQKPAAEQEQKQAKSQENAPPGSESTPGPLPASQSDSPAASVGEPKAPDADNTAVKG